MLEEEYGVRIVYAGVINIVEDMISSNFFAAISGATYIRWIMIDKMMNKHEGVSPSFVKFREDAPAAKTLSITHLDRQSRYICSKENILLIILDADSFAKNCQKLAQLHGNAFHGHSKAVNHVLHAWHW